MTTSVRGTGRGAATVQRTSVTVSSPVSVLISSHMPPPSTNRSMRAGQPDRDPVGVPHVVRVDDAPHLVGVRGHQPHPAGAAERGLDLDLGDRGPALPVGGVEAPEVGVGADRGARGELHPVPLAAGHAALDPGVEVLGHQRRRPEEEPALGQQPRLPPARDVDQFRRWRAGRRPTGRWSPVHEAWGRPSSVSSGWSSRMRHRRRISAPLCGPVGPPGRSQGQPIGSSSGTRACPGYVQPAMSRSTTVGAGRAQRLDRHPAAELGRLLQRVPGQVGGHPLLGHQQPRPGERAAEGRPVGDARRRRPTPGGATRQPGSARCPAAARPGAGRGTGTRPASPAPPCSPGGSTSTSGVSRGTRGTTRVAGGAGPAGGASTASRTAVGARRRRLPAVALRVAGGHRGRVRPVDPATLHDLARRRRRTPGTAGRPPAARRRR